MNTAQNAISPTSETLRGKTSPLLERSSIFRAVFFVVVDLTGFTAVNAFLYYLSTRRWLDLSMGSYKTALATPLSEVLLHPLSIFDQPWMMLVAGLLITAVVLVPIMVAVFYNMSVSALFVLSVAVVGHAPLLSVFLAGGCIIAGRAGLRRDLPLVALMSGLTPIIVYFFFFSGGDEQPLRPLQRLSVHLILVLALITAVLAGAVVSVLARIMQFRPGVIWPVILVFLAAPAWAFFEKVGADELDYAFIATRVGPGEALFAPPTAKEMSYPVFLPTSTRPSFGPASQPSEVASKPALAMLVRARVNLRQQRTTLASECEKFIKRHPDSARAAAVMWITATVKDIRIDMRALSAESVRYIYAGPSGESNGAWANLAERHPRQPQAFVAHQRLGIQAIREGRIQKAAEHLRIAQTFLATYLGQQDSDTPAGLAAMFAPAESLPGREYYRRILDETDNIIWLMETNKVLDGEMKNTEAFRDYMKHWPFTGTKSKDLEELEKYYQDTNLADNFRLRAALAQENKLDRAMQLSRLAGEIDDAAIAANYELGLLALRLEKTPAWSKMNLKTAEHYFKVSKSAQDNPYRTSAEQYLIWLAGRKQPATMPDRNTETP
ncbi:MAG: hypothetical protein SVV80_04705 [Planctomycetota bacterium]|nr:hypothetical protein [Planctomycetota bacterium]